MFDTLDLTLMPMTGITHIDSAHISLLALVDSMANAKSKVQLTFLTSRFLTEWIVHNADEERYMLHYSLANYESHSSLHSAFIIDIRELCTALLNDFNNPLSPRGTNNMLAFRASLLTHMRYDAATLGVHV